MSTAGMAFVKEHAAGEISPGRLRRYLCDEACSPGQKEIRAEACRSCESACAYGRRFLRLLDAGEINTEGKAVKRQIKHGKGEARKMGQAPKENERTGKTRQPAQAAERTASSMAAVRSAERANRHKDGRPLVTASECRAWDPAWKRAATAPLTCTARAARRAERANRRKDGRPQATASEYREWDPV